MASESAVADNPTPSFTLSNPNLLQTDNYINGSFQPAISSSRFTIVDPGTGKPWNKCADSGPGDVEAAVQSSHSAFLAYRKTTPRQRAEWLSQWHQCIIAAKEDLALILVHETGKPLSEARGEIDYALTFTRWFTGEAERVHGTTSQAALPNRRIMTIKQPIGVAAALVPWNFPVALLLRKAAAALAAGCTMVVKPSPETPISALALARLASEAGFPPGALNIVTTSLENTPGVAEALCLHDLVKKVTFTGSTRVGQIVAGLCARNLKKVTLELGGNCPFVVFDDADLEQAVGQLMALKWRHAGQACITANRVYIQRGIHDRFVEAVVEKTRALVVGHGMLEGVTMGPLTTDRGLDKVKNMVVDAEKLGAKAVPGTGRPREDGRGFFMAPVVYTGVTDEMLLSREEIFAPLLGISAFETEEEVVERANNTSMGLASYVFTKNVDRLWRMFENLEAGMIGLVRCPPGSSDPFGGSRSHDFITDELGVTEHGKHIGSRGSVRRNQAQRSWEGEWERCGGGRVPHHEDGDFDA